MSLVTEEVELVDLSARSGVAWAAIIAGAFAAAAISLILMVLGSGLRLTVLSPWSSSGASLATIAVGSLVWLIIVQWIASALGGYLTGRLRSRSSDPADEVFFRDTANGFLSWALSTVLVAALLTSALAATVGTGAQVAATVAGGAAQGALQTGVLSTATSVADPTAYFVDALFRPATPSASADQPAATATTPTTDTGVAGPTATPPSSQAGPSTNTADVRAETGRILMNGLASREFPTADVDYLANVVAAQTGLPADAAKQRVNEIVQKMQAIKADAQAAADQARKNAAKLSIFMFLALIIGAFIAAATAALGGQLCDDQSPVVVR
jgi:hypothetical protein